MMLRTRITIALTVAVVAGGIAVSSGANPLTAHTGTPQASQAKLNHEATSIPAVLRQRLRIFRDSGRASVASVQAAPAMDNGLVAALNAGGANDLGANPALARGFNTAAGPVYVVPGTTGLCHVAPGVIGCGPVSELDAVSHLTTINFLASDPPGTARVTGVVPDSVTDITIVMEDGTRQDVPVAQNVFGALVTKPMAEVDYTTTSTVVRQKVSYAPGTKVPGFQ